MLTLARVIPLREERIRLDGYTIDIEWGQVGGRNIIYWLISNSPKSLVEIGVDKYDGSVASISIKLIESVSVASQIITKGSNSIENELNVGLPCFQLSPSEHETRYIDEKMDLSAIMNSDRLIVVIGDNPDPQHRVNAKQVLFGFSDDGILITLEIVELSQADFEIIKQTLKM